MATKTKEPRFTPEVLDEAVRKRAQHKKVTDYLEALEQGWGKREDPEKLKARIDEIKAELETAAAYKKLELIQKRVDFETRLSIALGEGGVDFEALEASFVEEAYEWASRKGYSYQALREYGVPANILAAAGITRAEF